MTEFTDEMKLKVAKRELTMRKKVYPGWVRLGRMKQNQADYEIAGMQAIVDDYSQVVEPSLPMVAVE